MAFTRRRTTISSTTLRRSSGVEFKRGLRCRHGRIATAGGLTSGMDMALHVVSRYCGVEPPLPTAKYMEYTSEAWRLNRKSTADKLRAPGPHRVVMLAFPDAQVLDITGPLEVFARSARWLRDHAAMSTPPYALELVTRDGGLLRTSGGLELVTTSAGSVRAADTLLIAGGIGYAAAARDAVLLEWIRRRSASATRVGSICTGAFLLAAAGLLEGRDATTHWAYLADLGRAAPGARVENNAIYVRSGKVYTSAGEPRAWTWRWR